mmetsp:Transcript_11261/g.31158  ORF Transcript_11261/g.31158 Transcript_11261/m.31158 type:complete len:217 (+) Transcript_11261:556-1206(+)
MANTNDPNHRDIRVPSISVTSSRAGTSGRCWKASTDRNHTAARPEPSDSAVDNSNSNAAAEMAPFCRSPMAAEDARPPSRRKIGSRFSADDTRPENPTTNKGWIGTGCAAGNIMTLGASHDSREPTKRLDFSVTAGRTGNRSMAAPEARTLAKMPSRIHATDVMADAAGPTSARSSRAARFLGKDFSGVTQPNSPSCGEGMGMGLPSFILRSLAMK